MNLCPCSITEAESKTNKAGLSYADCCEPYITGIKNAPTAEALMRSRYSAYAVHAVDYIIKTCLDEGKNKIDFNQTKDWSEKSNWLGLKIISVEKGGITDREGLVEFEAVYERDGLRDTHHEKARFKKNDDKWFYQDGDVTRPGCTMPTPPAWSFLLCQSDTGRSVAPV